MAGAWRHPALKPGQRPFIGPSRFISAIFIVARSAACCPMSAAFGAAGGTSAIQHRGLPPRRLARFFIKPRSAGRSAPRRANGRSVSDAIAAWQRSPREVEKSASPHPHKNFNAQVTIPRKPEARRYLLNFTASSDMKMK